VQAAVQKEKKKKKPEKLFGLDEEEDTIVKEEEPVFASKRTPVDGAGKYRRARSTFRQDIGEGSLEVTVPEIQEEAPREEATWKKPAASSTAQVPAPAVKRWKRRGATEVPHSEADVEDLGSKQIVESSPKSAPGVPAVRRVKPSARRGESVEQKKASSTEQGESQLPEKTDGLIVAPSSPVSLLVDFGGANEVESGSERFVKRVDTLIARPVDHSPGPERLVRCPP
jgi:hypothetical protein